MLFRIWDMCSNIASTTVFFLYRSSPPAAAFSVRARLLSRLCVRANLSVLSVSWLMFGRGSCPEEMNTAKRAENGNIARNLAVKQD